MQKLKNALMLSMTGAPEMPVKTKCCAFPCLPGDYEDDEPTMFMETLKSKWEVPAQVTSCPD